MNDKKILKLLHEYVPRAGRNVGLPTPKKTYEAWNCLHPVTKYGTEISWPPCFLCSYQYISLTRDAQCLHDLFHYLITSGTANSKLSDSAVPHVLPISPGRHVGISNRRVLIITVLSSCSMVWSSSHVSSKPVKVFNIRSDGHTDSMLISWPTFFLSRRKAG